MDIPPRMRDSIEGMMAAELFKLVGQYMEIETDSETGIQFYTLDVWM